MSKEYNEGQEDFNARYTQHQNPYAPDTTQHDDWKQGFLDAMQAFDDAS